MLLTLIKESYQKSRCTYGAPRILAELRTRGVRTARKRVQRLMREAALSARRPRRFTVTTKADPGSSARPNVLARRFDAGGTNQKWAADITYIETGEGWLYLAVVIDLFSRKVVGHATDRKLGGMLAERALLMALGRRTTAPGLIHHSDRGSQYTSFSYQQILHRHGLLASMSRKGDCWDNAPVESFFATLKKDLVRRERFAGRRQAREALFSYIECFYNTRRRHSSLDYVSPADFENIHQHTCALAA
jgi:putative transposase